MADPTDIQQQLATLLGREVKQVRKTEDVPAKISVIDVVVAITGKDARHSAQEVRTICDRYQDVDRNLVHVKFLDSRGRRGQKDTPVTDARGIVEIVMLLPGNQAARVRREAAELLCRWLGGDLTIIDEVCRNRGLQEDLAVQNPEDPRRAFGEAVEVGSAPVMGEQQLARVCTDIVARTLPRLLEQITAHLDERLAQVEARQHVNLNVRAPKRAAVHNHPMVRDIA
jgi:hypothetical protein